MPVAEEPVHGAETERIRLQGIPPPEGRARRPVRRRGHRLPDGRPQPVLPGQGAPQSLPQEECGRHRRHRRHEEDPRPQCEAERDRGGGAAQGPRRIAEAGEQRRRGPGGISAARRVVRPPRDPVEQAAEPDRLRPRRVRGECRVRADQHLRDQGRARRRLGRHPRRDQPRREAGEERARKTQGHVQQQGARRDDGAGRPRRPARRVRPEQARQPGSVRVGGDVRPAGLRRRPVRRGQEEPRGQDDPQGRAEGQSQRRLRPRHAAPTHGRGRRLLPPEGRDRRVQEGPSRRERL